jgi:hypothetical protein
MLKTCFIAIIDFETTGLPPTIGLTHGGVRIHAFIEAYTGVSNRDDPRRLRRSG